MFKAKVLLIISFILSIVSTSSAFNIIYVDANGPNDPGTGEFNDPFLRIQDAIDLAVDSDIVEIRPGIYTGEGNYDLDPNGKSITICSINPNDPNNIANTIIDPNWAGRGFYFNSNEDANCVVAGLTIRNAYSAPGVPYGGCVYCYSSSPTIRDCIIKNGQALFSGGGLHCTSCKPRIINCTITGNSADFYGGGISCYNSSLEIIGCVINDNTAFEDGGGLCWFESNPTVINCIITNNKATNAGGINCYSPGETEASLVNCTITRNCATNFGGGLCCQDGSSTDVKNSIIWANEAEQGLQISLLDNSTLTVSYCNIQGGEGAVDPCEELIWGSGNIDSDPCFASFDPNGDPNTWDFHLQSTYGRWDPNYDGWVYDADTSVCIDAADLTSDWSSEPWPNGKRVNMGAYGGTQQASMNGNPGDFDIDGAVNFEDFCELADKWRLEGVFIEDLSGNGVVEFADLHKFAENWLWQR